MHAVTVQSGLQQRWVSQTILSGVHAWDNPPTGESHCSGASSVPQVNPGPTPRTGVMMNCPVEPKGVVTRCTRLASQRISRSLI